MEQYLLYSAVVLTIVLGSFAAAQTCYVWLYARASRGEDSSEPMPSSSPRTAVIVCLRGHDPSLEECLRSLAAQRFSNLEIHIAFDSEQDTAVKPAKEFVANCNRPVQLHFLPAQAGTCGLKCDLQSYVIESLGPDVEIVVFMDADGIARPDWLERLVAPLSRPNVGAVSGNRWFESAPGWGSQIRRYWNAAAIVQMYLYRIPWGGALAMRKETIQNADLLTIWRTTLCEDTVVKQSLQPLGLDVVYLPRLVLSSRETTSVSSAANWISRQLLTAKLYHPSWPLVAMHSLSVGASVVVSSLFVAIALIAGAWTAALLVFAAFILYQACNLTIWSWIETSTFEPGTAENHGLKEPGLLQKAVLITATQLIHSWAAIRAATMRDITWRGIRYRVVGRKIEMLEYHPYQHSSDSDQSIS